MYISQSNTNIEWIKSVVVVNTHIAVAITVYMHVRNNIDLQSRKIANIRAIKLFSITL